MASIRDTEDNDLDRSIERIVKQEDQRATSMGFAVTRQGQAMRRKYVAALAEIIGTERRRPRNRRPNNAAWRALCGVKGEDLALRLLTASINLCGVEPVRSKIALYLGRAMDPKGKDTKHKWDVETTVRVGAWGIDVLCERTGEGRKRAQAAGVKFGRKPKLSPFQRAEAIKRRAAGERLADIAKSYAVDISMISRL
jgi:hypothetical protein